MTQEDRDYIRQEMWNDLIPNLIFLTKNERKKAKQRFAANLGKTVKEVHTRKELEKMMLLLMQSLTATEVPDIKFENPIQFVDFSPSVEICKSPCNENKKEKAMCYEKCYGNRMDPEAEKRAYLEQRANHEFWTHDRALQKQFNILDMDPPSSPKEMADRLSKGLFVIDDVENEKSFAYSSSWLDNFRWRDPAKPEDRAGYEAAYKELFAAKTALHDQITIADPKDALIALEAFKNWKPTTATTTTAQ